MSDTTTAPQNQPPEQADEFDDERDEGSPEPEKQRPGTPETPAGQIIDLEANPPSAGQAAPQPQRNELTRAAELVPVGQHGALPGNFAHQITLAQYMAKANLMVPQHFHGNVGDCLAIIDIATRAGLSPYMVAAKTYKDPTGKGIAFESQLYHAFLIQSGWLADASLHVKYDGEGDARTCTVWGTLRGETEPRYYTSPPLKDLLPAKNTDGVYKGSPLWADKPDVQMFYDTSRDWGRMFSPIATLGMLAQGESVEHPIEQRISAGDGLRDRLKNANNTEGHRPGHAETELAHVASDAGTIRPASDEQPAKPKPAPKAAAKPAAKPQAKADQPRTTTLTRQTTTKRMASAAADRAEKASAAKKAEAAAKAAPAKPEPKPEPRLDDAPKAVPTKPKTAVEYQVYCRDWIARTGDPEAALARWDKEREMRDDLEVRMPVRNALRSEIERKHGI